MTFEGRVVAIHIAGAEGAPMHGLDSVSARAGQGLVGDRYFDGSGTYSEREGPGRQVTLIEGEALDAVTREQGIELAPGIAAQRHDPGCPAEPTRRRGVRRRRRPDAGDQAV